MEHEAPPPGEPFEHPFVHEPAPPTPRQLVPDRAGFVRGLALAALAGGTLLGAGAALQRLGWLASPLAAALGGAGLLSAWAAAIHLTGGEKFDDHPWV
jgi:hypothetical protein